MIPTICPSSETARCRIPCSAIFSLASWAELARFLGIRTNNYAEWTAVEAALEEALRLGASEVDLRMDSELVARQISGRYRVKHPDLKPTGKILEVIERTGSVCYRVRWVDSHESIYFPATDAHIVARKRPRAPQER